MSSGQQVEHIKSFESAILAKKVYKWIISGEGVTFGVSAVAMNEMSSRFEGDIRKRQREFLDNPQKLMSLIIAEMQAEPWQPEES